MDLVDIARRVLRDNGFEPELPPGLDATIPADGEPRPDVRDLRDLPWSSIDNAESRDLDQVEVAERLPGGELRVCVGIAHVAAYVATDSPIDRHARTNAATLYTPAHIFPMLPEALSTDRTSLLDDRDRLAMITEIVVRVDGSLDDDATRIYPALIRNRAKLVYEEVGAWLEGHGEAPADEAIAAQVTLHDEAARRLRRRRYERGALELETIEARTVARDGRVVDLVLAHKDRAKELVEDLMIAANSATARFLERAGFASIRRVVKAPRRWERIVALAASFGATLPADPSAPALAEVMAARRRVDPGGYTDLSLSVVKLMGPGMYVLQRATDPDQGHFGLAVDDYTHSTAPNRRYPDLITQRLLVAAVRRDPQPYTDDELLAFATHCTERENAARKVERTLRKAAAAVLLSPRVGEQFDAIVTGVKAKATYARLVRPPAEGRVVHDERGLDVGDRIRVKLVATDAERGFIDFARV